MKIKSQVGLAVIEFAYSLIIFFVLIFSVIEFGRAMLLWSFAADASREAARIASICNGLVDTQFIDWLKQYTSKKMRYTGQALYYATPTSVGVSLGNTSEWLKLKYLPEGCTEGSCQFVKVNTTGIQINIDLLFYSFKLALPENSSIVLRENMIQFDTCPY